MKKAKIRTEKATKRTATLVKELKDIEKALLPKYRLHGCQVRVRLRKEGQKG